MLLIGKGATVSFTIIVGQVSNGTETIMEMSVAENANANASLLTQAFKTDEPRFRLEITRHNAFAFSGTENENNDGDCAMWNLIIFDKLITGICLFKFF